MKMWLLVGLFVLTATARGDEVAVQFEQANQLYRLGDYKQAADFYEKIVQNGYEHPVLYYNLGNAYYKLKNIPAAILNYERAKRLAPHDEDIAYNLRLANLQIIDKIEPLPKLFFVEWWNAFLALCSSSTWASLVIASLWGAVAGGTVFILMRNQLIRRFAFFLAILCVGLCIVSVLGMIDQRRQERFDQNAIVFAASVSVKSSPDPQSTDLFVLHEGVKVEVMDEVGGWKKIRLPDGKIGWIPEESQQMI